jgi:hypothetical protein
MLYKLGSTLRVAHYHELIIDPYTRVAAVVESGRQERQERQN